MPPENPQIVLPNKPLQAEKMVMKKWFRSLQPVQLYIILTITLFFFLVQLVVSHLTHALTLLVDAYHVLCNLIGLFGCIITLKYGTEDPEKEELKPLKTDLVTNSSLTALPSSCSRDGHSSNCVHPASEKRLKNTFGWARIDVLVMLIVCVFLFSLCFSLIVESIQTLIHIDHHDEMHNPIQVLSVGAAGLLLNGVCYLLIGGYTFHQGSYLHVTPTGDIVLQRRVKKSGVVGNKNPSSHRKFVSAGPIMAPPKRQGPWEVCRDIIGCIFVMVCAVIVYFSDPGVAKFVDPIASIISAILLLVLSYPYMKESCLILLQTIPDHINIDSLCSQLLQAFPDIVNVHDLHVWQLTANKTFSTAHIIFLNPQEYTRIKKEVMEFFHEQGVTQVTIQPEFFRDSNSIDLVSGYGAGQCLVQCNDEACLRRACCILDEDELQQVVSKSPSVSPKQTVNGCSKQTCKTSEKEVCKTQETMNPSDETKIVTKPLCCAAVPNGELDHHTPMIKEISRAEAESVNQTDSKINETNCSSAQSNSEPTSLTADCTCSVEINSTSEYESKSTITDTEAKTHLGILSGSCINEAEDTQLCCSSQKICIIKEQPIKLGKLANKTKNEIGCENEVT